MRDQTCGKIPHETPKEAMRQFKALLGRKGKAKMKSVKITTYFCPTCGGYHWGRVQEKIGVKRSKKRHTMSRDEQNRRHLRSLSLTLGIGKSQQ